MIRKVNQLFIISLINHLKHTEWSIFSPAALLADKPSYAEYEDESVSLEISFCLVS